MSNYRRRRDPIIIPYINTIDNPGPLYIAGVSNTYIPYTSGVVQNNQWYLANTPVTVSPGVDALVVFLNMSGNYQTLYWDSVLAGQTRNISQGNYFVLVPGTSAGLVLDSQPVLSIYDNDTASSSTSRGLILNGAAKFFLTQAN